MKHNGLHFCCPHYNKDFMRRCDSKDGNCTHSVCCKLCEGRKHTFHLDSVCCFYTCSFPESAVERRPSKRNEGKSLLRKQTNKKMPEALHVQEQHFSFSPEYRITYLCMFKTEIKCEKYAMQVNFINVFLKSCFS